MKPDRFRALALELPEAVEQSHMGHPDFRVGGRIFATLGPALDWGMVKLKPAQQQELVVREPAVYAPCAGAWGAAGATRIELSAAKVASVRAALRLAWRNAAPRRLPGS